MGKQAISALRMAAQYTSAASAAVASIRTWNALRYPASPLESLPTPESAAMGTMAVHSATANDSGAHGRNPEVGDREAQTYLSITIQDASRLMSRICLRRSLAASGRICLQFLPLLYRHGEETLQPPGFKLQDRDTRWPPRWNARITGIRLVAATKTPQCRTPCRIHPDGIHSR